jgi:hypothetical protein
MATSENTVLGLIDCNVTVIYFLCNCQNVMETHKYWWGGKQILKSESLVIVSISDKATPSKFRPMGHFYCRTEKKIKFTTKFKFSSIPVMRTSFDKRLNDWSIENESKNSAWLQVKTLSSSVLMYSTCFKHEKWSLFHRLKHTIYLVY